MRGIGVDFFGFSIGLAFELIGSGLSIVLVLVFVPGLQKTRSPGMRRSWVNRARVRVVNTTTRLGFTLLGLAVRFLLLIGETMIGIWTPLVATTMGREFILILVLFLCFSSSLHYGSPLGRHSPVECGRNEAFEHGCHDAMTLA
jgi:hypothetical protein